MTRQITASDINPGMTIEWTQWGITSTLLVRSIEPSGSQMSQEVMASGGGEVTFYNETPVTVLSEPEPVQPDEPLAFGACVEVAGVKYVRFEEHEPAWVSDAGRRWRYWADILDAGQVTIVNPDPFASIEPREPRVWGRWADVPDRVTVRLTDIETPYRKVGDRIECKRGGSWGPAFTDEYDLNKCLPFTEVLDA